MGHIRGNIERVRSLSALVERQLENTRKSDEKRVSGLGYEELQDLGRLLQIADYLLCKHEGKREIHALLRDFVSMAEASAESIGALNDQIDELMLGADAAVRRIRELQAGMPGAAGPEAGGPGNSGNNLTKSATLAYTHEYQQSRRVEAEQVV